MIAKNVVITEGRKIGINPIVSQWSNASNPTKNPQDTQNVNSRIRLEKESNPTSSESNPTKKTVKSDPHIRKTINTVDNIDKTIPPKVDKSNPKSEVDFSCFNATDEQVSEIKRIRKANQKTKKSVGISQRVANKLAKEFALAAQFGFTLDDCLTTWETRGWTSFEAEWVRPKHHNHKPQSQPIDMDDTTWSENLNEVM